MVSALGRHVLAELHGCRFDVLNDVDKVEKMVNAALEAGAEIRSVCFISLVRKVSGVVVISESHLAIHTWPELGYAAVDVFTCGDTVNPWDAAITLLKSSRQITLLLELARGKIIPQKVAVNL